MLLRRTLATLSLALSAPMAFAHVTLLVQQAPAGSDVDVTVKVPHGCEGAATMALRVSIPAGATNVTVVPKPGWTVDTASGKYAQAYPDAQGKPVSEGVQEVLWTGGRLPATERGEFTLRLHLPDQPGATLYFPTVQECETGVERWVEIPEAGKSPADYKSPAPKLLLLPRS